MHIVYEIVWEGDLYLSCESLAVHNNIDSFGSGCMTHLLGRVLTSGRKSWNTFAEFSGNCKFANCGMLWQMFNSSGNLMAAIIRAKSAQYHKYRANIAFRLPQSSATVCFIRRYMMILY
jgi:hypothetical protein